MSISVAAFNLSEAQNAYQRLSMTLDKGSIDTAIIEIKTFLKMFPDMPLAHNDLAVLYFNAGNLLMSLAHYEKANRLQPDNPVFIRNLAEFYFTALGWTDDAIELFTGLLKKYPNDFDVLTSLGNISVQVGQLDEAKIFYKKASEIDPLNQELRAIIAELNATVSSTGFQTAPVLSEYVPQHSLKGDTDAVAAYRRALANDPANAVLHNNLAATLFNQGDFAESGKYYEKAVNYDPDNTVYRKNLADLYYCSLGRTDDAIEIYTTILKHKPNDVESLIALAIISKANNLTEQARIFIKKVLDLEPWNSEARAFLADL